MCLSGSWKYIDEISGSRLSTNKTRRHVYDYGEGIEVIGVAGELLVRRFLGLEEKVHERFDHGVDIHYCGMRIDVKATILTPNARFRFLQWPTYKRVRADYIVMTVINPITKIGAVIGYATKEEVQNAPINMTRSTPCHEISFMDLHPYWDLVIEADRRNTAAAIAHSLSRSVNFPALESNLCG